MFSLYKKQILDEYRNPSTKVVGEDDDF